jgi:site-specific DNA recombinase
MAQGSGKITGNTAVGYIRVSTDDQADSGLSLEHQESRIRAYANANGLDLVGIVRDEGVSAGKTFASRRGGAEVLALRARHIVALKLDRLFRNTADALTEATSWDKAGVGLHLIDVHGSTVNTKTAMGRMFFTMMAGFAELERGLISERTASAMQTKKARGEAVSGPTLGHGPGAGSCVRTPPHPPMQIARWDSSYRSRATRPDFRNWFRVPAELSGYSRPETAPFLFDRRVPGRKFVIAGIDRTRSAPGCLSRWLRPGCTMPTPETRLFRTQLAPARIPLMARQSIGIASVSTLPAVW